MKRLAILRQQGPESDPYWQRFEVEDAPNMTIAALLDTLNYNDDLFDIDGNPAPRVHWECSCLQGQCGACAMVINGQPALACDTFLRDLASDEITLAPLSKFPVVADLIVDRGVIEHGLQEAKMYLEAPRQKASEDADTEGDSGSKVDSKIKTGKYKEAKRSTNKSRKSAAHDEMIRELQYTAARCLRCGLCLEICPNYLQGNQFRGSLFANNAFLLHSLSRERRGELKEAFDEHFLIGCSKSLACEDICPMGISTIASLFFMSHRHL